MSAVADVTTVADVLNGAADLIERDGWCQHRSRGSNGEHCLTDALVRAAGTKPGASYGDAAEALASTIGIWSGLSYWNDQPGRTKAEVVAALRAAAERAA